MVTNSTNAQSEYLILQFNYTTAEIERLRFFGEISGPLYYGVYQPSVNVRPMVFTVIDSELCEVKDEYPPGARLPDFSAGIFKLAEAS